MKSRAVIGYGEDFRHQIAIINLNVLSEQGVRLVLVLVEGIRTKPKRV